MTAPTPVSDETDATAPRGGFIRKHAGKLIASVVITVSLVYTLEKGGLKIWPDGIDFRGVRWWTLGVYLVLLVGMTYFRAVRWRFLLRSFADVPRRKVLAVSWIGFAAILIMPFRLGEIVRPYMIREKGKVSMSSATGTVLAERVVDGLYLSIVLAVALLVVPHLDPLPDRVVGIPVAVEWVRRAGFIMLGVFAIAFTVIAVFYFQREMAHRLTLRVFGLISPRLGEKLAGIAERLAGGLHFLGRWRDAGPFLLETTAYWGLNMLGMWILAWGCGVVHADGTAITVGESCALMGMLGVAVLIPGSSGFLGLFQAGIYAGMTMYFPTSVVIGAGQAYVFLLYAVQFIWTLVAAAIFLVGDRSAWRELKEAGAVESAA